MTGEVARMLVGAAAAALGLATLAATVPLAEELADRRDRSTVGLRKRYFARRAYVRATCTGWALFWLGLALFTYGLLQAAGC